MGAQSHSPTIPLWVSSQEIDGNIDGINSNTHEQLIFSSVLYPTIHDMLDESGEISLRPHVAMAPEMMFSKGNHPLL